MDRQQIIERIVNGSRRGELRRETAAAVGLAVSTVSNIVLRLGEPRRESGPSANTDTAPVARLLRAAEALGLASVEAILCTSRAAPLVRVRHAIMWSAYRKHHLSLPTIAAATGRLDHTTVLHAVRKMDADAGLRALAERISEATGAS